MFASISQVRIGRRRRTEKRNKEMCVSSKTYSAVVRAADCGTATGRAIAFSASKRRSQRGSSEDQACSRADAETSCKCTKRNAGHGWCNAYLNENSLTCRRGCQGVLFPPTQASHLHETPAELVNTSRRVRPDSSDLVCWRELMRGCCLHRPSVESVIDVRRDDGHDDVFRWAFRRIRVGAFLS